MARVRAGLYTTFGRSPTAIPSMEITRGTNTELQIFTTGRVNGDKGIKPNGRYKDHRGTRGHKGVNNKAGSEYEWDGQGNIW